jgi:predicted Zn-dependent peptidase
MIQMSGGAVSMDYDQERTYYRGTCLDYDTRDTLQMMFDVAFQPKSASTADVARAKNQKNHDM